MHSTTSTTTELQDAIAQRDAARAKFNAGTGRTRRLAEEDLNFWQGKVAALQPAKPTVRSNDVAAMRAIQQAHNYEVQPTAEGWTVRNKENGERYQVTVYGRCTCPHFIKRLEGTGEVCKHFSLCNLWELAQPAPAPAPRSYDLAELRNGWNQPAPAPAQAPTSKPALTPAARRLRDFGPEC